MKAIVCVNAYSWGIGYDDELLYHISADMKRFKEYTIGKTVVMGRKTYDSIGKALPDRMNIVITRDPMKFEGSENLIFMTEKDFIKYYLSHLSEDIICIGGETLYKNYLDLFSEIQVTKVYDHPPRCNKFFPDLSKEGTWAINIMGSGETSDGVKYEFIKYTKNLRYYV